MQNELSQQLRQFQPKIHGLAFGMTLGIGSTFLSQGCVSSGTCPACGACAVRLSLLAVPLLLDGTLALVGKLMSTREQKVSEDMQ